MDDLIGLLGLGLGIVAVVLLVALAVSVFIAICNWRIYCKCGLPGWASLIPGYNMWVLAGQCGTPLLGLIYVACIGGGVVLAFLGGLFDNFFGTLLGGIGTLASLASMVVTYMIHWQLIKGLGKPGWYMALCILCPVVYYPLMAFTD